MPTLFYRYGGWLAAAIAANTLTVACSGDSTEPVDGGVQRDSGSSTGDAGNASSDADNRSDTTDASSGAIDAPADSPVTRDGAAADRNGDSGASSDVSGGADTARDTTGSTDAVVNPDSGGNPGADGAVSGCARDAALYRVGSFRIGGLDGTFPAAMPALTVTHDAEPAKSLFSTTGNAKSFVSMGKAKLSATESRGAFTVTESVQSLCQAGAVQSIACEGGALVLRGHLAGATPDAGADCSFDYQIKFIERANGRLGFDVTAADPSLNYSELRYDSAADEAFYGFGEQYTYSNLKGKKVPILLQEQGIGRGEPTITPFMNLIAPGTGGNAFTSYVAVPQYVTTAGRSLFLENSDYAVFDLSAATSVLVRLFSGHASGQIIYGANPLESIERYTEYSGRMAELPSWIHDGAIVGMQGGTTTVRDVLTKLKTAGTPIAAFWLQDWVGRRTTVAGSQLWWNWELDTTLYPDWTGLRADMTAAGARVLGYINPFLADASSKTGVKRNLYTEAVAAGYLVKAANGSPYQVTNSDFTAGLLDLTNPAARTFIQDVMTGMLTDTGFSGWMADYAEALPFAGVLSSGEPASVVHNQYPSLWADTNLAAFTTAQKLGDSVFFMRSGSAKTPGKATLFWLGDQTVTWDDFDGLQSAIIGLMGGGISGFALNHGDIGGYTTINQISITRTKELLQRWMEFGAFTTVFRTHEGNQPESNVQAYTDTDTIASFTRLAKVYKALGDYRKALVKEASTRGLPVVRHPWLHYPADTELRKLEKQQLEFMLGPDVLVAPVLAAGATQRTVYLPAGEWVHLFRGDVLGSTSAGGTFTVAAPVGTPPAFVRKGTASETSLRAALIAAGVAQ